MKKRNIFYRIWMARKLRHNMPSPSPTATAEAVQQILTNPDYLKIAICGVIGIWCIAGLLVAICLWKI